MKLTAALTYLIVQTVSAQTSCFQDSNLIITVEDGECSYDDLIEGLEIKIENKNCANSARDELRLLLNVQSNNAAKSLIQEYCDEQFTEQAEEAATKPLTSHLKKDDRFLKEYFNGGTQWNEEIQYTDDSGIEKDVLANDAGRVDSLYNGRAQKNVLAMPEYDNLDNCSNRAVNCCWVQDRQANDNNGKFHNCVNSIMNDNLLSRNCHILYYIDRY